MICFICRNIGIKPILNNGLYCNLTKFCRGKTREWGGGKREREDKEI